MISVDERQENIYSCTCVQLYIDAPPVYWTFNDHLSREKNETARVANAQTIFCCPHTDIC